MPTIRCCQYEQQPTEVKEIESQIAGCKQFYMFLKKCAKCGGESVELFTVDKQFNVINKKRIKTKNIDSFFDKANVIRTMSKVANQIIIPRIITTASEGTRKMARNRN